MGDLKTFTSSDGRGGTANQYFLILNNMTKEELAQSLMDKYNSGRQVSYGDTQIAFMSLQHLIAARNHLERIPIQTAIRKVWIEIFTKEIKKRHADRDNTMV